ncbi:hypothetical protein CLV30_108130 [Haloactinopolyspora alba]|uniref:Trypsin-like peptidase n=1 Tax=Haloactinopolyspora alba TaxID=648780 RepID=A0A2P8E173_9ACTN|nr:hypothetical protein [Haloactinopolyspora alba]PSL03218.1 hypothetical protein CLV30_108130 [Haloactinopolyspora alba]
MHLESAREIKAELRREAARVRPVPVEPRTVSGGVAVGICVRGSGTYGVAVRSFGRSELTDFVSVRGQELAGDECDVRDVGIVRALQWDPAELQRRQRPLRPGLSVAHVDVTAGTLGAFVTSADGDGTDLQILSNNHVLANSGQARVGDAVTQPGAADGGTDPADRVGTLSQVIELRTDGTNVVDAATAELAEGSEIEPAYPSGVLDSWSDVRDDLEVEKVGRTTGTTRGRVTAIEVDDVGVEYPIGVVDFENQIEVGGIGGSAFSAGGDSGSMVYDVAGRSGVGLLFAGSERGGEDGLGLTYCNPIGDVLRMLGVRLVAGEG